ncbi:competence/damage-inducible protein A [Sphingobacteriales bacterium UPWRP_1]|nr:competence/damage-inducible protein A [Sphingobacteriales bacterium TSM_CSS]PSJ75925.1 competence/damage-inducible protein A [Sphingobacteriales bacterium UPWRP_1]
MNCTLITIGDEILIGQTIDTNSAWMAKELNAAGISVFEIISVSDNAQHISDALDRAFTTSDIVLTTGGLGPTKDDITKNTLAAYFGAELKFYEDIWKDIETYMAKRGVGILESHKTMAMLPANCEVIKNERGTAAAMWFNEKGKILVAMPGVPHEMKDFMSRVVIQRLQQRFTLSAIVHKTIMCAGAGETILADIIKDIENSLPPHIKLAYLPSYGIVKLRLTAKGANKAQLTHEVEALSQKMVELLTPKFVFGYDDEELPQTLGNLLLRQNATLVTAESCTGGLIAHQLTSFAGSSRYYKGGVVSYSNELKQSLLGVKPETLAQYGAVSEETVSEMAAGVVERLQADYAVAVSGIAGPDGGTPEKPVGTVWIAVAGKSRIVARKFQFARSRDINIELSANIALNELRKFIIGII